MLIAGSDDGVYTISDIFGSDESTTRKTLDSGRVMRVRQFEGLDGLFAATTTGLYYSPDAQEWTDLGVPVENVYAVAASPARDRVYAGTRPAGLYVAQTEDTLDASLDWRELDGFQDLPSRDEWRLPRHEDLAQVRDVHVPPGSPDRVLAGVEVGGVHVSEDGGETWVERRGAVHDDVHELHVIGPDEYVAATGFGLFRTTDAGRSWTRLDRGVDQRYFRSVCEVGDAIYAGGALSSSSSWDDDDADPALFAVREGDRLEKVDHPRPDETVTGITGVDGRVLAGTHRGTILRGVSGGWAVVGSIPVDEDSTGRYTPLSWFEA